MTSHTSVVLDVGRSTGSRFHFPDKDPVCERPVKRFRITCKSSADKRPLELSVLAMEKVDLSGI